MKVLQKAVRGLCARLRMLPSYRATQAQHDAGDESASSLAFDMAGDLECITELPEVLNCLKHAATLTEACFQREQARHAKADAERDANVAEEKRRLREGLPPLDPFLRNIILSDEMRRLAAEAAPAN